MPVRRTERFLRVKLDMVGRCQLRCVMCHFAHPQFVESKTVMDRALLEKVADDLFPRAHDVVLSSSAEPLLAPDLPRALELCRKHGVPNFHFSTNGIGLTDKILDTIIDVEMPVLTISIDGGTPETFESIRVPMKWDKMMEKLDLVAAAKRRRGSRRPILSVTTVLMMRTIREMPDFVRLMHSKGVEHMNMVHMGVIGDLGVEHESLINAPELSNEMLERAQRVADEVGILLTKPLPFPKDFGKPVDAAAAITDASNADASGTSALGAEQEIANSFSVADFMNHKNREFLLATRDKPHHNRRCYFPWYYIHVNPDGTVFPCGSWFEFSTFGDFKTQDFRQIWTGKPFRELRRQILDMELRDVCANCSVSNMGRPDVLASFSHRAKVKRDKRAATSESWKTPAPDPQPKA
ncbi:MAG: radical SAM protein [Planctomycetes bacterium]|nr:radical SAM protein [Planctomycetota bacterium]